MTISQFWKKFGDFISPLGRAIVTGEWKHFGQQVLNIATIAMGVMSGNPYLVASGSLSFFNTATSEFQGGDWGKAHRIIGYTATALAIIGTGVEIGKSINAWNERNQLINQYETNLIEYRKEALENGIFDTAEFYSRDVNMTRLDRQFLKMVSGKKIGVKIGVNSLFRRYLLVFLVFFLFFVIQRTLAL